MSRLTIFLVGLATVLCIAALLLVHRKQEVGEDGASGVRRAPVAPARIEVATGESLAPGYSWLVEPGADPRAVAGIVVRDGAPVDGAAVRLVSARTRDGDTAAQVRRTDSTGRFTFGEQPPMEVMLVVSAPTAAPFLQRLALDDPTKDFDDLRVELRTCNTTVKGRVVDVDGTPIPGAVCAEQQVVAPQQGGPVPAHMVTTDEQGDFTLCTSGARTSSFAVTAQGYGTVVFPPSVAGSFLIVRMAAEGAVMGSVVDAEGRPVAGAMVVLTRPMSEVLAADGPVLLSAMSDADGAFFLGGLASGSYLLGADHARFETPFDERETVALRAGETVSRTIVMQERVQLAGTVLDGETPVIGRRVDIDGCTIKTTQRDGTFVTWCVESEDEREVRVARYDVVRPATLRIVRSQLDLVIDVSSRASVTGRVVSRGNPVAGALVAQGEKHLRHEGPAFINVRTDEAGRFVLAGVASGRQSIAALDPATGYRAVAGPFELEAGVAVDIGDLELDLRGALIGRVADTTGTAMTGYEVTVRGAGTERRATTGEDGSFSMNGLPEGEYEVGVSGRDRQPVELQHGPARVAVGGGTVSIDLLVAAAMGVVVGRTLYEDGQSASGARVRLRSSVGATDWTTTDFDGRFELGGLSGQLYDLEARGQAGESTTVSGVSPGGTELTVRLGRAGNIRGTLLGGDSATVRAHREVDGVGDSFGFDAQVAKAREGEFELSGLVPGGYRLVAVADGGVARARVVVEPGQATDVVLRLGAVATIRGRAVHDGTGHPIAGASCGAAGAKQARTSDDGLFVLEGVSFEGRFMVRCESSDGTQLAGSTAARGGDRDVEVEVRLVMQGARLGARFEVEQGRVVATEIAADGPAAAAGLQRGDSIVAVDGVRVSEFLLDCLAHLHLRPPEAEVTLRVERDGVEQTVLVRTTTSSGAGSNR